MNTETKVIKKRGRKPREKSYSVKGLESLEPEVEEEIENIIIHLPVSSAEADSELTFDSQRLMMYDPVLMEPTPYSPNLNAGSFIDKKDAEPAEEPDQPQQQRRVLELEDQKSDRTIKNVLTIGIHGEDVPNTTDVVCWWCCHKFEDPPVGIPVNFTKGRFEVYGNFCCFNCACSYLFNSPEYSDKVWNCYSLMNLLHKRIHPGTSDKVRLAPPRQALKLFGGFMSIEEFRYSAQRNEREFKLLVPPMTVVMSQVEETKPRLDETLSIPVNRMKMQVAADNLKLSRSKPMIDTKHTLKSFMSVKKVAT